MNILDRAIGYLAPHTGLRRARQRAAIALLTAHAVPLYEALFVKLPVVTLLLALIQAVPRLGRFDANRR